MFIYKRTHNTGSIELFQQKLHETKWDEIMSFQNPDDAYKAILKNELEYKNYNIFLKQSKKAPKTTFF